MDDELPRKLRGTRKRLDDSRTRAANDPSLLPGHAAALRKASVSFSHAGQLKRAMDFLREASGIYAQLRDVPAALDTLSDMLAVLRLDERFEEAADLCRRMADIAAAHGYTELEDTLRLRRLQMEAAARAGIDVPEELAAAAWGRRGSGEESWVYEVDKKLYEKIGTKDHVPPEAIIRGWQVDPDGHLTGLITPNPRYQGKIS